MYVGKNAHYSQMNISQLRLLEALPISVVQLHVYNDCVYILVKKNKKKTTTKFDHTHSCPPYLKAGYTSVPAVPRRLHRDAQFLFFVPLSVELLHDQVGPLH